MTDETNMDEVTMDEERIALTESVMAAAKVIPESFAHKALLHYAKALRKHPRFADALFSEDETDDAKCALEQTRGEIGYLAAHNWLDAVVLAICELEEAQLAHAQGDKAACVDELYDAVAVLMRMIAVVEGKQRLGKEN